MIPGKILRFLEQDANVGFAGSRDRDLVPMRGTAAAVVFQEPLTALNPLMKIGKQVAEVVRRRA